MIHIVYSLSTCGVKLIVYKPEIETFLILWYEVIN